MARHPAPVQHGIGARGQGKLVFVQTRIAQAIRHSKARLQRKDRNRVGYRDANGHWV
jgi:hypothetical protein